MSKFNYLFILTGSISVYKICDIVSDLVKQGHNVRVVMSKSAQKFVNPIVFSSLSNHKVYTELFDAENPMDHISLQRWADKIVIAPASANFINKVASGIGDDLGSTLLLAHDYKKPVYLYPAMNSTMLKNPIVQKNLNSLTKLGVKIGKTQKGILACGEMGEGKLLEVEKILKDINGPDPKNAKTIIITAGGTVEDIDGVRYITNFSTGTTGANLADDFILKGYKVIYIHGKKAQKPMNSCQKIEFSDFESLENILKSVLKEISVDYIIQAAAISDFSISSIESNGKVLKRDEKIPSTSNISIHMNKNKKIIAHLKTFSCNKNVKIIGFKLTHTKDEDKIQNSIKSVMSNPGVSYVVHNSLGDILENNHTFNVYNKEFKYITCTDKDELAYCLDEIMQENDKKELRIEI